MTPRPVITGWAVVSPIGSGRGEFVRSLMAGRSGAGPIQSFDASGFPCKIAAEVRDLPALEERLGLAPPEPHHDRKLELGMVAAHMALEHAGLTEPGQVGGISLGTGLSSVIPGEVDAELVPFLSGSGAFDSAEFARVALGSQTFARRHDPGATMEFLATLTGCRGPKATHFSACTASTHAIALAASWVRRGEADRVIAGGMDSMIHPFGVASFVLLGTLTTRNHEPEAASRPFDRDRDGFLLAEGAAMVVVESLDSALARGATPLAEVLGAGSSVDAHRVTAPHPQGRGAELAMRRALDDAGIAPAGVDYVNAHGTGTKLNDPIEIAAFRRVFGARGCPISSTKSMHGHLIAAAGALEACVLLATFQEQRLPPTLNLEHVDPDCDADLVPLVSREARVDVAMSNSFGFGGQNGSIVLGRCDRDGRRTFDLQERAIK